MRSFSFVLCLVFLAACDSDKAAFQTTVMWMDWPAEVNTAAPLDVRMVVLPPCIWSAFRAGSSADQSAVTFAPYFLGVREDVLCAARTDPAVNLVLGGLDTTVNAPALTTTSPRTFEIRGATSIPLAATSWPVRTFGEVIVRPNGADGSRRNAGGIVYRELDTLGCVRIRPVGSYKPGTALVLENPSDTVSLSGSFVRGYIFNLPAPLCGETRGFHLVSQN
jgi:hypothetical protein